MRIKPAIYYETPGGASGGGGGPAAPTPAQPTPQPGAPGQGQGQGDGFRQTFFANVPDEHWQLIEPHISGVNRHVTQLEQRYAPFRQYSPEAVQGLAAFVESFERDPANQWIELARTLQTQGALDPELDLDYLAALVRGEDPDAEPAPSDNGGGMEGLPPEASQLIQQLQEKVEQLEQGVTQQSEAAQRRVEDAALSRQMNHITQQLTTAGFPEGTFSRETLMAHFIAHRGNAAAVVKTLSDLRSQLLGDTFNANQGRQKKDLDTSKGVPKSNGTKRPGPTRRGMFAGQSAAAEQYLRSQNQDT
jgi:hypothetical protein